MQADFQWFPQTIERLWVAYRDSSRISATRLQSGMAQAPLRCRCDHREECRLSYQDVPKHAVKAKTSKESSAISFLIQESISVLVCIRDGGVQITVRHIRGFQKLGFIVLNHQLDAKQVIPQWDSRHHRAQSRVIRNPFYAIGRALVQRVSCALAPGDGKRFA